MSSDRIKNEHKSNQAPVKQAGARAGAIDPSTERRSSGNGPVLPAASTSADPMASVLPQPQATGAMNQLLLPPDARDPMAPVQAVLPPSPGIDSASAKAPGMPVPRTDALPVSVAETTARLITHVEAARRRRAHQRIVAALCLLLVLIAAGLAIAYVTGFVRIGPAREVAEAKTDFSDGSTLPINRAEPPAMNETRPKSVKGPNRSAGETESERPSGRPKSTGRAKDASAPDKPSKIGGEIASLPDRRPEPPVDSAQVARFQGLLVAARQSLGERGFAEARRKIAEAKQLAASEEQNDLARGFESLATYVEGFWEAVGEGMKGLGDAGELQVGNTIVSIVEVSSEHLIIRAAGQNRRYAIDQLPAGLAMAIANRWFDERPDNKVFLGAFLFVDPRTDVTDAKRMWEEAAGAGIDVTRMLSLLPIVAIKAK